MLPAQERVKRARENYLRGAQQVFTVSVYGEGATAFSELERQLGCRVIDPKIERLFKLYPMTDENGEPYPPDEFGNQPCVQVDIFEPDPYEGYYAQVRAVPLTAEAERVLGEFDREEQALYEREHFGYRAPPGTATLLFDGRSRFGKGVQQQYLKRVGQPPKDPQTALMDQQMPEFATREHWAALPPEDPRARAYMDGLNDRAGLGPIGLIAVTSEGAQQTLDQYRDSLSGQLRDAAARRRVKTAEEAERLYNEVVESAIRDHTVVSAPGSGNQDTVFADNESWMRWTASLAKDTFAPVLQGLPARRGPAGSGEKRPTRKNTQRRAYLSPEEARLNRNRTLDTFFGKK